MFKQLSSRVKVGLAEELLNILYYNIPTQRTTDTQQKNINQKPVAVVNYIRAIFDFGFFTFMIPYRIVLTNKGYALHSNVTHKAICCFIQLLILFETSSWLILAIRKCIVVTAFHYLVLAHIAGCLTYRLICICTFWFRRKSLIQLLQRLESLDFLSEGRDVSRKVTWVAYGVMFSTLLFAVSELVAVNLGFIQEGFMGGDFTKVVSAAKVLYLNREISKNSTISDIILEETLNGTSILDILATGIHVVGILPHYVCMNSLDKSVLVLALLGRHLVLDFLKFTKQHESNMDDVFRQYGTVRDAISGINESFGILPLILVMGCLPFYPTWTGVVLLRQALNWYQILKFLSFFGTFFLLLAVAADMNSKMGEFYKSISSRTLAARSEDISVGKLTALSMDMYSEQIALTGGGFFKMTYGFFGTILSVIVTYTMIIIQFQFSRE